MGKLQIIDEREVFNKRFRIFGTPEEPLFLAKDVAEWIGHSNSRMMLDVVDEDEKLKKLYPVNNPYGVSQEEEQWFLTENGLYEILMQSRKPIAKQFKAKVKEILKDIRKQGFFMTDTKKRDVLLNPMDFVQQLHTEHMRLYEAFIEQQNIVENLEIALDDNEKFQTVLKYTERLGLNHATAYLSKMGKQATFYCNRHGYEIRKNHKNGHCFGDRPINMYPIEVLEALFPFGKLQ